MTDSGRRQPLSGAGRSISFGAPMVLALLAGCKTQTRRLLKPPAAGDLADGDAVTFGAGRRCPYGVPGDRLWVREAFRLPASLDACTPKQAGAAVGVDPGLLPEVAIHYVADGERRHWIRTSQGDLQPGRWRSPLFMPRWASRLTLELTAVRSERLQTLSAADALAEGVAPTSAGASAIERYRLVWERIHGPGAWDGDPWVWVIGFRVDRAA